MGLTGCAERGHHVIAVDAAEGGAAEQVAEVVVEPRAGLDPGAVSETPVGDIGLP